MAMIVYVRSEICINCSYTQGPDIVSEITSFTVDDEGKKRQSKNDGNDPEARMPAPQIEIRRHESQQADAQPRQLCLLTPMSRPLTVA